MTNPGQFKKGFDPRRGTGGRKASAHSIAATARDYGPEVVEFLVKVLRDEHEPTKTRVQAGKELLNRGIGRPVSVVEMNVTKTMELAQLTQDPLS